MSERMNRIKVFAKELLGVLATDHRVYVAGNGGSASTASHFAEDLAKMGFDVTCLCDSVSRLTAIVNDSGWGATYTEQMRHFHKGDALVLFTVHGCEATSTTGGSQNVYEAAKLCKDRGGELFVFSGNDGGHLAKFFVRNGNFLTIRSGDCNVVEPAHVRQAHEVFAALKEMMK
jgi:D-sedoheptulose 7-phosphate isomerase